jgi:ribosome maturation factor RimP
MGGTTARRLQVMAETEGGTMLVEDCARLARALNPVLDAADPVAGDYVLEVSSPGVDRPLTRLKDFETYEGFEARLEIDRLAEGRKRFKGELAGVQDDLVAIDLEGETETALLPFAWLVEAKLVITDALLRRGAEARAARMEMNSPPPEGGRETTEGGGVADGAAETPPSWTPPSPGLPPGGGRGKQTPRKTDMKTRRTKP